MVAILLVSRTRNSPSRKLDSRVLIETKKGLQKFARKAMPTNEKLERGKFTSC